jgi:PKD repeat protein
MIHRFIGFIFVALYISITILPVTAATTQLHIVKYASDRTTILNETTKTYQWLEANLPVMGDGVTHYYHQGPVFVDNPDNATEQSIRWNPDEDTNVLEKDMGAVKGSNLEDICDLVGGMNAGETMRVRASDGMTKDFAYTNVYTPPARQGPIVVTWYCTGSTFSSCSGGYTGPGYSDGMRLVWFADTSVNPWGEHVFGNFDWHESAAAEYWYYYLSGSEQYPTTTGLSVKYISDVFIYSDDSPPSPPVAAFSGSPRSGTVPLTVTFTDASTGTGPLTYAWDFQNDGTMDSTLKSPGYQYTAAGTYTVNLTVTNAAGNDSEIKSSYITVIPPTIISPSKIGVVRSGNTWLLDASGNGMYGPGDLTYVFGKAGDTYVSGDWNGDDKTEIGVVRNGNTWLLDASGNGKYGTGDFTYVFGKTGDISVTGIWS